MWSTVYNRPYQRLVPLVGASAATTYCWLRYCGVPANHAMTMMRRQVLALGVNYSGGLECTPYRKPIQVFEEW